MSDNTVFRGSDLCEAVQAAGARAFAAWGETSQIAMVVEETGELLSALGKTSRGRASREDVVDEVADVLVVVLGLAGHVGGDAVRDRVFEKLHRLEHFLDHPWRPPPNEVAP